MFPRSPVPLSRIRLQAYGTAPHFSRICSRFPGFCLYVSHDWRVCLCRLYLGEWCCLTSTYLLVGFAEEFHSTVQSVQKKRKKRDPSMALSVWGFRQICVAIVLWAA